MSNIRFRANVDGSTVEFSVTGSSAPAADPAVVVDPNDAAYTPEPPAALSPEKRQAVKRRFLKVAAYTTLGVLLSVAGYATLTLLTGLEVPAWAITISTVVVSGFAGAIHKSINWVDTGAEVPEVPDAALPPLTLPTENT